MPYSTKHNLLFIHIPKTAGTTIECALDMHHEECLYARKKYEDFLVCPQHLTLSNLEKTHPAIVENSQIFTVVRNPYDRIVSEFEYIKRLYPKTWAKQYFDFEFEEFVKICVTLPPDKRMYAYDGHLESQYSYIEGNDSAKVHVFKFEKLNECFDWIKVQTNEDLSFGHEIKTERLPCKEYFTSTTKKLIDEFYSIDFEKFDYPKEI